jgi:hypothetical protein
MFHDVGLLEGHRSNHERFEIDGANAARAFLERHARTKSKTGMIEALAAGVRDKPETAVGTILPDVLEATVPGYLRPNACDAIRHSRFET